MEDTVNVYFDNLYNLIGEHIPAYAPNSIHFPFRITRNELIENAALILAKIYATLNYTRLADVLSLIILSADDFERIFVFSDEMSITEEFNPAIWCRHLLCLAIVTAIRGPPERLDYNPYDVFIRCMNFSWVNPDAMIRDIGLTGRIFPYMAFMRKMDFSSFGVIISRAKKESVIGLRYVKMAYKARAYLRKNTDKMSTQTTLLDTFCSRFNMSSCFAIIYKDEYSTQVHIPNFNLLLIRIIKSAFRLDSHFSEFFKEYMKDINCSSETRSTFNQKINSSDNVRLLNIEEIRNLNNSWHFSFGLLPEHDEFYISFAGESGSRALGRRIFEHRLYNSENQG
jgi:hypothetical protein